MKKQVLSLFSDWGFSIAGLKNNKHGEWWLFAQLLLISGHIAPPFTTDYILHISSPTLLTFIGLSIFVLGILLSLTSLILLGKNLSPLPEPKEKANLVSNNIYSNIRHPLYLSLILISIGLNIIAINIFLMILLFLLCLILIGKARVEEKKLMRKYKDYYKYSKNTSAIIRGMPFLDWEIIEDEFGKK